jgi:hypothetical protein
LAQSDNSSSQDAGPFDIRVETREVVVPVYVDYTKLLEDKRYPAPERNSTGKPLGPNPEIPMDLDFSGLAASDFHISEDGADQRIKDLSIEPLRFWGIHDDGGAALLGRIEHELNSDMEKIMSEHSASSSPNGEITYLYIHCHEFRHMEYSGTPTGFWSGRDMCRSDTCIAAHDASNNVVCVNPNPTRDSKAGQLHLYLLSYVPPPSIEGSCHQIKVTVDRPDASVYARGQYCNVHKSPSDTLKGTDAGAQMEAEAASAQPGKLPLSVQAVATFNDASTGRVNIAVEFPWRALNAYWDGNFRSADVNLLGLVYKEDGSLAARFSDVAYSPKTFDFHKANRLGDWRDVLPKEFLESRLPTRYEMQIYLARGTYKLRIVVTDGKNFGLADVPFTVENYNANNLAISGIVLSKRFVDMAAVWPPPDAANHTESLKRDLSTAPEYVPLVSEGKGYTPTGDTVFRQGDLLKTYFEVYEPLLAVGAAKVQIQMRVLDAKTGQVQLNSGLRPADAYVHPGNPIIPVGWEIPVDKLAKGSYQVEVEASDSAGKQTEWRAASFTVE